MSMTNERTWVTAGLVFLGTRDIDIVETANRVRVALARMGHRITGTRVQSDDSAIVASCCHTMRIGIEYDAFIDEFSKQVPRVLTVDIAQDDKDPTTDGQGMTNDMVLTHVLKDLHWQMSADYIRWVGHSRLLSSADFLLMTTDLPGPAQSAGARLARGTANVTMGHHTDRTRACASELADLRSFFREADADLETGKTCKAPPAQIDPDEPPLSAPQRLSAWLMAYAVLLFSLPVGIALLLVNLIKGENPRLASQAAALTGTFLSFQAFGTTAQAMEAVRSLLS